jgi:hypothetical protein
VFPSVCKKITWDNMQQVTLKYHKKHQIESDLLQVTDLSKDPLAAMMQDGWRFAHALMMKNKNPQLYADQFTASVRSQSLCTPSF